MGLTCSQKDDAAIELESRIISKLKTLFVGAHRYARWIVACHVRDILLHTKNQQELLEKLNLLSKKDIYLLLDNNIFNHKSTGFICYLCNREENWSRTLHFYQLDWTTVRFGNYKLQIACVKCFKCELFPYLQQTDIFQVRPLLDLIISYYDLEEFPCKRTKSVNPKIK